MIQSGLSNKKLKISLIQPNFKQGPGGIASYLPYSCGLLWSYALTNKKIKDKYELKKLVYKREPIEELSDEMSKMDVVAFSTYVWNRNYNFTLAKIIKEKNPNTLIVFGGPEPPITNPEIFEKIMPFCDVVVKMEGEFVFSQMLEQFITSNNFTNIKGLLINQDGISLNTGDPNRINNLDEVPSPYLTGVFDQILPLEKEWNGTLETNRGCPYHCTFCDWGSLTYSKVKMFGLERVFDEIEWMSNNKIGYLDVADANFGLFIERDNLIVDKLIEVQQKNGFPYRTGWSWAKNQKSEVVSIAKKLIQSGHFNNGLTISLQSLGKDTLKTIKRHNMDINKINEIFDECKKEGVPLNVELIVGLPGETFESWENTLYNVFEAGQHDSIEVWQAQILENAEMNLTQRNLYKIRGMKVLDYFPNGDDIEAPEYSEIVTETSTMSINEMVDAYKLSWFLITWHTGGFSQYVSRFIRKYKGESYKNFYTKFRKFLETDDFWKNEEEQMSKIIYNWYKKGEKIMTKVGKIKVSAATNQYRTIFKVHDQQLYQHFYEKLNEFLLTYNLPKKIHEDLIKINKCIIANPRKLNNYSIKLNYDILSYINNITDELKYNKIIVDVFYPHDIEKSKNIEWFLESIFYARRRSFGKNFLKKIK